MDKIFKGIGKGIGYFFAFPGLLIAIAIYSVFGLIVFVFQFFKLIVLFFTGRNLFSDLPEDIELKAKLTKDEPKEEEEKPLVNALPYEINGIEYLLPEDVINYIESLKTSKIEVEEKLTKMAEETPSAMPIGNVIKGGSAGGDSINDRIQALNAFKNWRENR